MSTQRLVTLDGSHGEGGGQILRTALTLSLVTGRPFRMVKVRANRDKPGLRPQHLTALKTAAKLGNAEVSGDSVGSRDVTFRPGEFSAHDLDVKIGTAGATTLVLHALHLPLALKAAEPVRVRLSGGTFNEKAPSFPFLEWTWAEHMAALGAPVGVTMPQPGFYPRGGGEIEATVSPAKLRPVRWVDRGPLLRVRGRAGVARLRPDIAERMRRRAEARFVSAELNVDVEIEEVEWAALSPGAAIALVAEYEGLPPATFVGLGERGKPSESVADEAVDALLAHARAPAGAVDPHSADQILLPLALAEGPSEYTVSEVTEHLRTNVRTVREFIDREITLKESHYDGTGRVVIA